MPHRDDRDAARSRIEALERRLAEAEAEREEAEAELARSEAEKRALERRLRGEPIPDDEWTRDAFARRVTTEAPKSPLDLWPERPAPIAPSPVPSRPVALRLGQLDEAEEPPGSRGARRAQLTAMLALSAAVMHLAGLVAVSSLGSVVTPERTRLLVAGQVFGGLVQCGSHFVVTWWLRAPHPFRALAAAALMSAFSALLVAMLAGGPLLVSGAVTALAVALHAWLVGAVARGERV